MSDPSAISQRSNEFLHLPTCALRVARKAGRSQRGLTITRGRECLASFLVAGCFEHELGQRSNDVFFPLDQEDVLGLLRT